ncbi:MAG: 2-oxo acid dehydrogenase subunit E2 [Actinobacteria bacterium]|nr:2-oxo acid dehydrogenase subunit E2 [Actinomycetota bacterium]
MADVTLPQLGETVTEGTITRWFKKVGDTIAADEPLFEISTDKVDTEVPSPVSGTVMELRAAEGDTVPVGAVIAVVQASGQVAAGSVAPPVAAPAPPPAPVVEALPPPPAVAVAATPAPAAAAEAAPTAGDHRLLSPVVRRLVAEHGIRADDITGTGPGGRITRDDVLDFIDRKAVGAPVPTPAATPAASPVPTTPVPVVRTGERDTTVALSKIRKLTGSHMVMSKGVSPHAFSVVEVDFANVDITRASSKNEWKATEGFSLTYLPFVTRAVVDALAEFPHLNASVADTDLVVHNFIDIGIAVDLDYQGLLVPVVRSAEGKRLRAIAREINDLAGRTRTRKLSPDEISGGTFTISNNGSAGSVLTMPIINQPQVAILSTDAIVRRPVVARLPDGGEAIVIHPVGNLAMSWDHRAFDGAYAAGFLVKVKELLEGRDWSQEL